MKPIPLDHAQIKVVTDMVSFLTEQFNAQTNLILLRRELTGDFPGLAAAIYETGYEAERRELEEKSRQGEKVSMNLDQVYALRFNKEKDMEMLRAFRNETESEGIKQAIDTINKDVKDLQEACKVVYPMTGLLELSLRSVVSYGKP